MSVGGADLDDFYSSPVLTSLFYTIMISGSITYLEEKNSSLSSSQ